MYGIPPDCLFQQAGASSHTCDMAQEYRSEKFPAFWEKVMAPELPRFECRRLLLLGLLQTGVERQRPKCLDSSKLAIRRSVEAMPLGMAQRAILSFLK